MESPPSDNNSQTARAALRVRELVMSGGFEPGERVSEVPLAERLGVSRTPLRLALASLAEEGLLESLPRRGFAVRSFSRADVDDAIELRGVLEGMAARLAVERDVAAERLEPLRARVDEIERLMLAEAPFGAEQFAEWGRLDERLHAGVVGLADSVVIEQAVERVSKLPFASPGAYAATQAGLPDARDLLITAQRDHRELIDAIARRQGARAESIAREHAQLARRNLELLLRERALLERVPGGSLVQDEPG